MFKIFVFCSLLVSICSLPSQHEGVDKIHVAVETEEKPQAFPVPVEQVLKSVAENKKEEPAQATPLKVAEPVAVEPVAAEPVVAGVSADAPAPTHNEDDKKFLALLLIKFSTTTTTPATTMATTMAM